MIELVELVLLLVAAFAGGALNSVAGGGSFFTFAALLGAGVPAISANATSSLALWPGGVATVLGYREDMASTRAHAPVLLVVSLVGALGGALLLLNTPPELFARAVPWLLLFATLAFTFGGPLAVRLRTRSPARDAGGSVLGLVVAQFAIAIYGGYFGGGMGILMLAAFTLLGLETIHAMNGLKMLLGVAIHAVAVIAFAVAGIVVWPLAGLMVAGAAVGGYGGARLARRVDPRFVRAFVTTVGVLLTVHYFVNPPV